jgi:hypothetical protein
MCLINMMANRFSKILNNENYTEITNNHYHKKEIKELKAL